MKLRELDIEHFGIFSQYQVSFANTGLQTVFGPNEAGKSTLLQLIREMLFGFAERNRYALAEHTGEMAATALIELANGKHVRYRRRKGRRNVITGQFVEDGGQVDETEWSRLLSGAGPELFENVFGFSLAELTAAEQSLKRANLREALYGGALGGLANFQPVLESIHAAHERLFTPTAKKRIISALLSTIKNERTALAKAQLKPIDYRQLQNQSAKVNQQVVDARTHCESLRRQKTISDRLIEAHKLWMQRAPLQQQFAALAVPDAFPADAQQQCEQVQRRQAEISRDLRDFDAELLEITQHLDRLDPRRDVVERTAEIRKLGQQLEQMRGFRRDLVTRQRESHGIKDQVLARLRALDPDWTLEQLDLFQASVAHRTQLESMEEEFEHLQTRRRELEARRPALQADIRSIEMRIEQLDKMPLPTRLVQLVDTAPEYLAKLDMLAEWQNRADELDTRSDMLQARVAGPFGLEIDDLVGLSIPLCATIESFQSTWRQREQAIASAEADLARMQLELRGRQQSIRALQASQQVPDRQQLLDARQYRDHGWELIRREFVDRQNVVPEQWKEWLADRDAEVAGVYEQAVENADQLADRRQQHAETVARQDQLAADVREIGFAITDQEQLLHAAHTAFTALQEEWRQLWRPAGLEPGQPDAMLEWNALHAELIELRASQTAVCRKVTQLRSETCQFESALQECLDGSPDDPAQRLAEARRRVDAARQNAAERKTHALELPAKQCQLATIENEVKQIDQEQSQWRTRWDALMCEFGFPTVWDVRTANRVIAGLSEARLENDKARALDQRIADMQTGLDTFERDTTALCRGLAPELNKQLAEDAVEDLGRMLDKSRQDDQDRTTLVAQRDKLNSRISAKKKQLRDVQRSQKRLMKMAGVDNEDDLLAVARRAQERAGLQQQIERLGHQIDALRGKDDPATFERQLDAADAASLASDTQILETRLVDAEQQFDTVLRDQTLINEQLRVLDQSSQAADLALSLESSRSQLRSAIDRWAPLVLAEQFMRQAIEQFEREHQPQLLLRVGELFARLTAGRYVAIRRKLDEEGTLLVETDNGRTKEPHELSTGTREQLYLAMRLAYVLRYCSDTEPLPIIMDDVLVNFDDQRALDTLRVLAEIARDIQVILLTCHRTTLAQVKQVEPDVEPVMLGGSASSS